jgi:hypothetical protein
MSAVTINIGSIYNTPNRRAFLPFRHSEYTTAHMSEIARQIGCVKNIVSPITNAKYSIFIIG